MRSVSCFRCNRRRPRPSRSCATPSRSTASRRHSPSRTTTHPTLTLLALGCCPCFVPSMSLSPTVLSGGGANSGAKVITPTAYKHGWLRREPSGPKKGGWRRCFCILWRLPSAAANEPFFLIYYPDRTAHKPDGFISTSSLSLSLLPPRHVASVRDDRPLLERCLSAGCVCCRPRSRSVSRVDAAAEEGPRVCAAHRLLQRLRSARASPHNPA